MIIDARSLEKNTVINADICIVGAGVAGLTLAHELNGQKFRVCILESGSKKADEETQSLFKGENVGLPYYPLHTARGRQFGGSSHRWLLEIGDNRLGGRLRPMTEVDFEKREWVPHSGWPFDKGHLDPYYERAQEVCKSGPYEYGAEYWKDKHHLKTLGLEGDRVETAIFQFVARDVFGEDYWDEVNQSENITTYINANVLELETSESGRVVERLLAACLDGKEFIVKAKIIVVAVGGIETPRLLLLSNKTHMNGIGNQNDLVGRFFMEHPHLWSGYIVPTNKGLLKNRELFEIHRKGGVSILQQLALSADTIRQEKILNYNVHIVPGFRPGIKKSIAQGMSTVGLLVSAIKSGDLYEFNHHLSTIFPAVNNVSVGLYRKAVKIFNKVIKERKDFDVFRLNHMVEQSPNPNSRVSLSSETDRFGQRRVQLDWRLNELDIRTIVRAQEILNEELRKAGLGRLELEMQDYTIPLDIHGGWHHMGTTRMHVDPRQGVVDENSRVHGMENLYIAGPSLFPTSGYANPILTIVAMTTRLADHLKSQAIRLDVAA